MKRHRDLEGRHWHVWVRRSCLGLVALVCLLGLANVFGQRPGTLWLRAPAATLKLYAPSHVRGGLLWEARFTLTARRELRSAVLQFSPGWNEGTQLNTIEPSPIGEGSRDGDMLLTLGHVPAGHVYRLFMEFQTNATNVGRRRADVTLYDGATKIGTIHRTVTVFP